MADVSLTVNSKTFTFSEGDVKKVSSTITSKAEQVEIAASGPGTTQLYDYDGSIKMITVSGVLTDASSTRVAGYSIDTIIEQKQWLESLINGSQNSIKFVSTYESLTVLNATSATPPYQGSFGYTYLMLSTITFTETEGNPNKLDFTMQLMIGTV